MELIPAAFPISRMVGDERPNRLHTAMMENKLVFSLPPGFLEDIQPLIPGDVAYDPVAAAAIVQTELVARLAGEPWRGAEPG